VRRIGIDARKLADGGIGRYVVELLRRLPALAPDVRFIALLAPGGDDVLARAGIAAATLETVAVGASGYSLAEHVAVGRAARAARLDLLHVPHYVLPAGVRCPVVVTVHDLIHWRLPRSVLHAAYVRVLLAMVRRRARVVLTGSRAVADDLVDLARIPRERIRIVPNGVDAAAFAGPDDHAAQAALARRGVAAPYLLNVTNGLPHKGLDLLLAAFRDIDRLQLVLAGRGSDRPAVRAAVERSGLRPDAALVLGELSEAELRAVYRGAAAVVVASRLEGFGLPVLEAMAAGVPVVAARTASLPEVVGDAGVLFPVDSVACLREALYRFTPGSDLGGREEMIRRGLARAREYTWERTAQETYAAYEWALRSRT
jgi:glycosyltransferase involved in cell wall biosynthesis